MSYAAGHGAIFLEKSQYIPRTEYSAHFHWDLVRKVTGIAINSSSTQEEQEQASAAFVKAWDYGTFWNILINSEIFGDKCTKMGHAAYSTGGADFDNEVYSLYEDPEDALTLDPWEFYGSKNISQLTEAFNQDYAKQKILYPEIVPMTGIYVSLMSGLLEIFGWDIMLMSCGIDAQGFGEVANRYTQWIGQYFEALANSHAKVVMVHDDITWTDGAFFHPDWYRKYIFPNYQRLFQPLREANKRILFTSDGNYTAFIKDIADCGVNGFILEPTTDLAYVVENYGQTHTIIGNADTRILLNGSKEAIYGEVKRCMDIGRNAPGFMMAVGNHIPANTSVENAVYYDDCYRKLSRR